MGRRKFFIFHCFIAVLFCGILQGNAAQPRATEILERLAAGFRAMDGYGVKFGVVSGDYEARGSYVVEGDSYYLVLGDAEVFADGAVRREVDNRRREVTVTEVDTASRNILNNPVRAFDFLGSEYTPSLVSEADGRAVVRLTPAAGNDSPAGDVTLTVDTATMRPRSLSYDYDGEQVLVNVLEVAPSLGTSGGSIGRTMRITNSLIFVECYGNLFFDLELVCAGVDRGGGGVFRRRAVETAPSARR